MSWVVNDLQFQAMQWHDPQFLAANSSYKPQFALKGRQEARLAFPTGSLCYLQYWEMSQRLASTTEAGIHQKEDG